MGGEKGEEVGKEMTRVVLSNAFSLGMLPATTETILRVKEVSVETVKELLAGGFESAIGHETTAQLLTPETKLVVFQLLGRLPEGRVLTFEELSKIPHKFYVVEIVDAPPQRGPSGEPGYSPLPPLGVLGGRPMGLRRRLLSGGWPSRTRPVLMKATRMAIELLIDIVAIAVAMIASLVIPSILSNLPNELVYVAVGGVASFVTLTVADLKKLLRKIGEK